MLFKITNGAVTLGGESVLENINFEIRAGEKIAVVGRNGAGKSTLLKCVTGEMPVEEGTGEEKLSVARVGKPKIGYLKQITFTDENRTMLDELLDCFKELLDMQARLDILVTEMEKSADEKKIHEYTALNERFELLGGYTYKKEYSVMVNSFGFSESDLHKSIKDFSGGQRTKIAFIKLLLSHPDILLLDEPTNHLDIDTVRWLEGYIKNYRSAVVIVSHDRLFIERTVDKIYEIEYGETHLYKGSYSDYEKQKKKDYEKHLKDYEYQQKEIARLTKLVERFRYKATKAAFAQAKLKQIERMKIIDDPKKADTGTFHAEFQPVVENVKRVLTVNDLVVGYDSPVANISLELLRGEKLGIIGENGIGKSTFLKTLVGKLQPLSGEFTFGEKTQTGYFDQNLAEYKRNKTVKDDFHDEFPGMTETEVRNTLGAFLFTGEDVFTRVNELSGGERVRLALCKMFKRRPNVLILDEPTNHLDIIGRETLEEMLCEYTGTVIAVSHDRYFINKVTDRLLVFEKGGVTFYPFGYEEYEENQQVNEELDKSGQNKCNEPVRSKGGEDPDRKATPEDKEIRAAASVGVSSSAADREAFKERSRKEKRMKKLEELMAECEERIAGLSAQLEAPENSADYVKLSELQEELDKVNGDLDKYTEEWLELSEELE